MARPLRDASCKICLDLAFLNNPRDSSNFLICPLRNIAESAEIESCTICSSLWKGIAHFSPDISKSDDDLEVFIEPWFGGPLTLSVHSTSEDKEIVVLQFFTEATARYSLLAPNSFIFFFFLFALSNIFAFHHVPSKPHLIPLYYFPRVMSIYSDPLISSSPCWFWLF
ncbi:hypothetical protein B0T24DRAFT_247501 [Lasiosphaeria ovina]|uniref:Uncharacterized protein n=1 Tax=Lasiosphaeria ovina TaxID=92902 RepID=A0AAE0KA78_9PEZI|nr:hypothetical protein B0T24DRAFT_247501 [Lasiosphaeria ovina]